MKTLYCIPGIGADERIFGNLVLESIEVKPLRWLSPMAGESISGYARRLARQIDTTRPYSLLGVSFEGMIAIELAGILEPRRLILVSSVKGHRELPWYARMIGRLRLHKSLSISTARYLAPTGSFLMGASSNADRDLLKELARDTDASLFKWSVDQALRWSGGISSERLIHIHGTADRILPFRCVRPDYSIIGGTHLMIFNRANEISALLQDLITGHR